MKKQIRGNKSIVVTVSLILIIGVATIVGMFGINRIAEEFCWDTLRLSVGELEESIESHIRSDQQQLILIAEMLSRYDEDQVEEIQDILHMYKGNSMIDEIEILYPDNTVLTVDGDRINAEGILSFEKEAALGVHVSDRENDLLEPERLILRNYVPVIRNDKIVAMLYGVIDLTQLPDQWKVNAFDGEASVYIVDGATGDFIADTWHKSLGNIAELGSRQMKPGYTGDQLHGELLARKTGYVVFVSKTIGEYLYFYYEPIDVNQWVIALSVPETIAFDKAMNIRWILYAMGICEAICFTGYLIWMLKNVKKETQEKQKRLEMVSYIYDVEKKLFSAYRDETHIESALCRIADMTTGQVAFFKILADGTDKVYLWCGEKDAKHRYCKVLEENRFYMDESSKVITNVLLYNMEELRGSNPGMYRILKNNGIYNLMEVPVWDEDEKLVGLLGVLNVEHQWESAALLENVALSFAMTYNNRKLFEKIREMGEIDVLTGLKNRNSYESRLEEYGIGKERSLACVYADANGLHELNNKHGHEAGDNMLRHVAKVFAQSFGSENSYRIGGDEFVAFVPGIEEKDVLQIIYHVKENIENAGYHASIGVQWEAAVNSSEDLNVLVKKAEQHMYDEKDKYYKAIQKESRR